MSSEPYDAVVIGAGPAGYVCAIRLAQNGLRAAIVERGEMGGTCLNVGCIPSKALIRAAKLKDQLAGGEAMGLGVEGLRLDLAKLVAWKDGIVKKLTGGVGSLLKNHGVTSLRGSARIASPTAVEVAGAEGTEIVAARHIVLATGSVPIEIPGFPFGEQVWSSTEALSPRELPARLLVIGGGYIGLELGIVYARLGSQVTVVEATAGLLPGLDPELSKVVRKALAKRGVAMHFESFARGYEQGDDSLQVTIESTAGEKQVLACDRVLSTVGRRPFSEGLGLVEAGVQLDERGFAQVDGQRRTSVETIFAIGDLAGQPMLAHKGSKEGLVVADVIAGQRVTYDARCVPAVVFTEPEIATVGLTEEQARAAGHDPLSGKFPFAASGRAMTLGETQGFVKIIADRASDRVLGVHMVGPEVTELIAEAALAIEMGATAEDIALTIHAHPTLPECLMEAAEALHGKALHIFQRKR